MGERRAEGEVGGAVAEELGSEVAAGSELDTARVCDETAVPTEDGVALRFLAAETTVDS